MKYARKHAEDMAARGFILVRHAAAAARVDTNTIYRCVRRKIVRTELCSGTLYVHAGDVAHYYGDKDTFWANLSREIGEEAVINLPGGPEKKSS